ncbi:Gfo/Idh/MocA family oxidoreductase [Halosquirtibacter xylanolyticus]|uniref:Gfo/Idh/MocA family protein n=1 Tax=Halosquirtibacter xylanolyticus TaxID=3374599 RepID=UPI00374891C9|nr:Gfo/Idh/MocA family oxidoreductase [Prolixibacteraceae bacterium]
MMEDKNINTKPKRLSRRDILKGLATVPIVGALAYGVYQKKKYYDVLNQNLLEELDVDVKQREDLKFNTDKVLRIGVIGYGRRASYLLRSLGFAHPDYIEKMMQKAKENEGWNKRLQNFMDQENLGVEVTGICDIYDVHAENAIQACQNIYRQGKSGKMGKAPKRYHTYKELLESPDIDAVIIGTPDHWHAPIAIEAAKKGKHVYCEKPLSWTIEETYEVRKQVKKNNIVFQLGHQNRQTDSYHVAKNIIEKGALGKISLIEVCTNRNSDNGAWVYDIDPKANRRNIDWKQFIGQAPWHEFDVARFFRWRCWWDYSTGLSGDLFTHEFDAMNQILDLGMPSSVIASGGIYYFKDGRTVPDVLTMAYEYEHKDMTLLYSATQANQNNRGRVIMGHDASMTVGSTLEIKADRNSTKYKEKIKNGLIDPDKPIFNYVPGRNQVDAVSSATEKYFAGRGLLYTYRNGKQVDTTYLHLKEWLYCIRLEDGTQPSCDIDRAFEEAMASHMGTVSYKEGRKVYWDFENEKII